MIYRDFQGMPLSALGFGAMRLPVIGGDDSRIDEDAALEMVDIAMKNGVNYYDTAWGYHGENSELVMGKALARYPRDSFCLATKFPGYDPSNWNKVKEIFPRQLEKLGVDYFDFYLFHNVCEMICRNTCSLEDYSVLIICREIKDFTDCVLYLHSSDLVFRQAHVAVRFQSYHVWNAGLHLFFDFFKCQTAA